MTVMNNVVKIPKTNHLTSEYVEKELKKIGYGKILRWAIVEVSDTFYLINFCSF